MIRAWEYAVMERGLATYKRVYAWFKLVKVWVALRSHDAEGLPPPTLVYEEGIGMVGDIVRSKTTGLGKKVEVVQMHVSAEAFVPAPMASHWPGVVQVDERHGEGGQSGLD